MDVVSGDFKVAGNASASSMPVHVAAVVGALAQGKKIRLKLGWQIGRKKLKSGDFDRDGDIPLIALKDADQVADIVYTLRQLPDFESAEKRISVCYGAREIKFTHFAIDNDSEKKKRLFARLKQEGDTEQEAFPRFVFFRRQDDRASSYNKHGAGQKYLISSRRIMLEEKENIFVHVFVPRLVPGLKMQKRMPFYVRSEGLHAVVIPSINFTYENYWDQQMQDAQAQNKDIGIVESFMNMYVRAASMTTRLLGLEKQKKAETDPDDTPRSMAQFDEPVLDGEVAVMDSNGDIVPVVPEPHGSRRKALHRAVPASPGRLQDALFENPENLTYDI